MTNDPVCTCDVSCLECAANRRKIMELEERLKELESIMQTNMFSKLDD